MLLNALRYIAHMKKLRPILVLALLLIIFGAGLWLGSSVPRWLRLGGGPRVYNTATVLRQVQTLSQLVTVKYVMEKVVVMEDVKWFGENRVLLVAHGIVKAGVDLGELRPEDLQVSGTKISIQLPPAQVTDAYLLALAVKHDGRLVTFDTGVALEIARRRRLPHSHRRA